MPTNPNKPNKAPTEAPATQKKEATYNGGGWGGTGKFNMQRSDQGQDFEIELNGWVTSPGTGKIIAHASDGPFPNGFGSTYAVVEIKDGAFATGNGQWYVGHANEDVRPVGTELKFGDHIARANNSLNAGWGWVEVGKWDGGPHEMGYGNQFRHLFEQTVNGPAQSEPTPGGPVEPGTSSSADIEAVSKGAALSAFLQLPSILEYAESQALKGQRSLMNDQPLLPFVEQVCTGSLRSFMSLPNGDFYAFVPDYFGGLTKRQAYWEIDDIEILNGQIDLSDDALATHVYVVGDTSTINGSIDLIDKVQTAGIVTIFNAFMADFISGVNAPIGNKVSKKQKKEYEEKIAEFPNLASKDKALSFLNKYGARPYYEEAPMIRSHFFEMFVAYQRFCLLWSKQFLTTFEFTFMPELIPGGIVKFPHHGIQCYIDEVSHEGDYEKGFVTRANLSAPAAIRDGHGNALQPLEAGMIRGGIFNPEKVHSPGESGGGNRGQTR